MTMQPVSDAPHSPEFIDAQYALDMAQGTTLTINYRIVGPDAAFVLGACRERGMSVDEAVAEALVEWAQ